MRRRMVFVKPSEENISEESVKELQRGFKKKTA